MLGLKAGTLGCTLSPLLVWLCIACFVTGFFAAGMIAVSLALIGDRVAENARQAIVGRFMGIVFLGQGISVGLGVLLAKYMSWRTIFLPLPRLAPTFCLANCMRDRLFLSRKAC
jgi:MFS family permease